MFQLPCSMMFYYISLTRLKSLGLIESFTESSNYPRRLLLHREPPSELVKPAPAAANNAQTTGQTFDANTVVILTVLLCGMICVLGLNSIIRCVLRCSPYSANVDGGGVKKKVLKALPTVTYSDGLDLPGSGSECAICLSEFAAGERVRVLPKCNHGFHVSCVDRWLASRSSCPTCRRCLTAGACRKDLLCVAVAPPSPNRIDPLDPEQPVYRNHN